MMHSSSFTYFKLVDNNSKSLAKSLLWSIVFFFSINNLFAQDYSRTNLQSLSNTDLLKQATDQFENPQDAYQRDLRIFYKNEKDYLESRKKNKAFKMPSLTMKPSNEEASAIDVAAEKVEHTKMLLNAYKEKLQLLEMVSEVLAKLIVQIDATEFSNEKFKSELSLLDPHLFEIKLRISDGSMRSSMVPAKLSMSRINSEKQKLSAEQAKLNVKFERVEQENIEVSTVIKETKGAINEMEIQLLSHEAAYSNEQKNLEHEKKYLSMSPQKLLMKFMELSEEKNWITSSFEVAYRVTRSKIKVANSASDKLDSLPTLTLEDFQLKGENANLKEGLDSMLKTDAIRIEELKKLEIELAKVQKAAKTFESESVIVDEHVSKMIFIANILKKLELEGKIRPDSILSSAWYESIIEEEKTLSRKTLEVLTADKNAKHQLEEIDQEIDDLLSSRSKIRVRLNNLTRASQSAKKVKEWETKFNSLEARILAEKFKSLTIKLNKKQKILKQNHSKYKAAGDSVEIIRRELTALKDPMFRLVEKESAEEKYNIQSRLYAFINKNALRRVKNHSALRKSTEPQLESDKVNEEHSLFENAALDKYQNILSQNVGLIEKKNKLTKDLEEGLDSLNFFLEAYISKREEVADILIQQNICAVKIKKLFSHNKIKRRDIPAGIDEALQYGKISSFESLTLELFDFKRSTQEELKT